MRPGDLCAVNANIANLWDSRRSPSTVIEEVPRGSVVLVLNLYREAGEVNVLSPSGLVGWMFEGHLSVMCLRRNT